MSQPATLTCPYDPAFECHWIGDARPPDGSPPPPRGPDIRCPAGYLPQRVRAAVPLEGKRVVTDRPATRRPGAADDDKVRGPDPADGSGTN